MTYAKNPKKKWYCYNDSSCKVRTFTPVRVWMGDLSRCIRSPSSVTPFTNQQWLTEKENKTVIWRFLTQAQVRLCPLWPWTCLR